MNPFLQTYDVQQTDEELVRVALEGDRDALDRLIRKHQPYIYNVAWKMVHNPVDAQDLAQEAMVKIVLNLSKFDPTRKFRTWAYRIVLNHYLNAKKRPMENAMRSFEDMAQNLDQLPNIEISEKEQEENEALIREMQLSCLTAMLLCLNREQRLVYIVGDLFGADHRIGGELLDISPDNFRAKLSKTRKDLYAFMQNKCGLVNKANPCRCRKKVTAAVAGGAIDARNLLNQKEGLSTFRQEINKSVNYISDFLNDQYMLFYDKLLYEKEFDRKTFLKALLDDARVQEALNLYKGKDN